MPSLRLVIGNKNTSSWSLRPWLALTAAGIPFTEEKVRLRQEDTKAQILKHSPSGKVPLLKVEGELIWDSLAICEWAAETWPKAGLWPADKTARAVARSVTAEMHSGFLPMRRDMPMDILGIHEPGPGVTEEASADIRRITAIWTFCRERFGQGGPFLFGAFSIADAFFAPVVTRFTSYHVDLDPVCRAYVEAVWAHPALQAWKRGAEVEEK